MSLTSLFFTTGIDGNGFKRGLLSMKRDAEEHAAKIASSMTKRLAAIGAAGVGKQLLDGLAAMAIAAKEYESSIADAVDQFQLPAEDIQRMSAIAKEAGTDLATVASSIDKISEARKKLAEGDAGVEKAFSAFGIPKELALSQSASSLQLMRIMSDSMSGESTEEQRRLFAEIAGDKSKKILTFVSELKNSGGIVVVAPDQLEAIGKAGDLAERIWTNTKAINAAGVGQFAKSFQDIFSIRGFLDFVSTLKNPRSTFVSGAIRAALSLFGEQTPIGSTSTFGGFSDVKKEKEKSDKEEKEKAEKAARRNIFGGLDTRGGSDSLASVGLFVRGGAGSLVDVQRKQLDVLTRMEAMQRDLLRVTREVL